MNSVIIKPYIFQALNRELLKFGSNWPARLSSKVILGTKVTFFSHNKSKTPGKFENKINDYCFWKLIDLHSKKG